MCLTAHFFKTRLLIKVHKAVLQLGFVNLFDNVGKQTQWPRFGSACSCRLSSAFVIPDIGPIGLSNYRLVGPFCEIVNRFLGVY